MPNHSACPDDRYRCGTLIYTKIGLVTLFSWLLWGDFCFFLMEAVGGNIVPLMLKNEGASNFIISLFVSTIPSLQNFAINPIISTASDRFRGKRGRRIPFILFGTPFICLFLVLIGFSHQISVWLHQTLSGPCPGLSASMVGVVTLCFFLVAYRFFELFVNTVFWYLFNDVVPTAFMGRFLGLFRVVCSLTTSFFNFFLFRHALTHTSLLFVGAALLYGSAFMLISFKVKEGSYPPPESMVKKADQGWKHLWAYCRTFVQETFSQRIYRLFFSYNASVGLQGVIGVFSIFMAFSLGLTLEDVGKINGIAGLVAALFMYPVGSLIDRLHPVRVVLGAQFGCLVATCFNFIFIFSHFSKDTNFWLYAISVAIMLPFVVALNATALPLAMRIFPPERFGQFCAANAMCACVGSILGGLMAGPFLDLIKLIFPRNDYYYRAIPIWSAIFMGVGGSMLLLIFQEWKKLGGDESYHPPMVNE